MVFDKKYLVVVIGLFVIFITSGLAAQIGLVIEPIADQYDVSLAGVGSIFSFLTGGLLLGNFLAIFIFDYVSFRTFFVAGYTLLLLALIGLVGSENIVSLSICLAVIGVVCGIGMCGGASIMTKLFDGNKRQVVLVAQDAIYNLSGAIIPLTTGFIMSIGLSWSCGYLSLGVFVLPVIVLSLLVLGKFDFGLNQSNESEDEGETEWNIGIVSIACCLFLYMMAQLMLVIWLPQYAIQEFSIERESADTLISNIFSAALISTLIAVYVVYKIRILYFLYFVVSLGLLSIIGLLLAESSESLFLLSYLLGIAFSATFNSLVVYGLLFVAKPSHKNVTFLMLMAGLGGALAPFISSLLVDWFATPKSVIFLAAGEYFIIIVTLLWSNLKGVEVRNSVAAVY